MKEYAENKRCESRTIQNSVKKQDITSNVRQNVLITDVPINQDFSGVRDLAIWWAMAAEWHFQKKLPVNIPNVDNLNPLDYIHSLQHFLPNAQVANRPKKTVQQGDRVRMLTHGFDPKGTSSHLISINQQLEWVNPIVDEIDAYFAPNTTNPLYCYMGNNLKHKGRIANIGEGPMLSNSERSVSLKNNMFAIRRALKQAPIIRVPRRGIRSAYRRISHIAPHRVQKNTWRHIINNQGCWRPINTVRALANAYTNYVNAQGHQVTMALIALLNKVYVVANRPYNDFARYLINQRLSTGKGPTLWQ